MYMDKEYRLRARERYMQMNLKIEPFVRSFERQFRRLRRRLRAHLAGREFPPTNFRLPDPESRP
jgi:ribosome-associated translation inhibitor RaiA